MNVTQIRLIWKQNITGSENLFLKYILLPLQGGCIPIGGTTV